MPLDSPRDLARQSSLFMMRTGVSPIWRLRRLGGRWEEAVVPQPRLLIDDMLSCKQATVSGFGFVALPAYLYRDACDRHIAAGPIQLDRRRFDVDRANALPARPTAIGPRLGRAFSCELPN